MKIQVTEDINGMKYVRMSDEDEKPSLYNPKFLNMQANNVKEMLELRKEIEREKTQADEDTLKDYMNSMAQLYTNVSQREESK